MSCRRGRDRAARVATVRGSARLLAPVAASAVLALSLPASAHHREGPCDVHRRDDETVQQHSKRLIRCAVDRWSVPGDTEKAICIADAESGLDPEAKSAGGEYLGLFQHMAKTWPEHYRAWTREAWELDESALSGRTNAIVTARIVNAEGWGAWHGVGDC
jgi:hypothetical protein